MNLRSKLAQFVSPLYNFATDSIDGSSLMNIMEACLPKIINNLFIKKFFNDSAEEYDAFLDNIDNGTAKEALPALKAEQVYKGLFNAIADAAENLDFEGLLAELERCAQFLKDEFSMEEENFLFTLKSEVQNYINERREDIKQYGDAQRVDILLEALGWPREQLEVSNGKILEFKPQNK